MAARILTCPEGTPGINSNRLIVDMATPLESAKSCAVYFSNALAARI